MMRRVARQATHSVSQMNGAVEVHVLQAGFVALQAALARLGGRQLCKTDDLRDVAPALHVRRPWSVAILASVLASFQQREMRRPLEVLGVKFVMARLAG